MQRLIGLQILVRNSKKHLMDFPKHPTYKDGYD
jgi:hypothetical protein